MKKKITRFIEDTFYTALIFLRRVIERLNILSPPSAEKVQQEIDAMAVEFEASTQQFD